MVVISNLTLSLKYIYIYYILHIFNETLTDDVTICHQRVINNRLSLRYK